MNVDQAVVALYQGLKLDMLDTTTHNTFIRAALEDFERQLNVSDGALLFQIYCKYLYPYHGRWAHSVVELQKQLQLFWKKRKPSSATDAIHAFLNKHDVAVEALLYNQRFMNSLHETLLLLYDVYTEFTGQAAS